MFWILRRTGAANFFTSMNSNYSSKSNTNNNNSFGELYIPALFSIWIQLLCVEIGTDSFGLCLVDREAQYGGEKKTVDGQL